MSETSNALVERLTAGTELVAEGGFHLDLEAAQAKLAEYRLADPQTFVLLLVEVAHLLPGCRQLEFQQGIGTLRVIWRGVALDDAKLRDLVEARNVAIGKADAGTRAHQRAVQVLGLALLALDSIDHSGASLVSSAATQQLELVPGASNKPEFGSRGARLEGTMMCLTVRERLLPPTSRGITKHRAELLRARARYASVPVLLDGQAISEGFRLSELGEPLIVRDRGRQLVGVIGLSPARPRATLLLVANGVLLEKVIDAELPAHFLALVQASDLPRDLGLTKLLRGEPYAARIQQIRRAATNVGGLGGEIARYAGRPATISPVTSTLAVVGVLSLLAAIPLGFLTGADGFFVAMMLAVVGAVFIQPASVALALRRARTDESRAIATVLRAKTLGAGSQQQLECLIHVPGGEPYTGHLTLTHQQFVEPGQRLHVHVNRRNRRHLILAAAPPPAMLAPAGTEDSEA